MNYFWKNDLVELKILDYDMEAYLEKSLYDDKTRKQLEKGLLFRLRKIRQSK